MLASTTNVIDDTLLLVGIVSSQHGHMTGSFLKHTAGGVYQLTMSLYSICLF